MAFESCQPYRELYTDLIEGELESPDIIRAEGHLRECPACRAELSILRGVVSNLCEIGEEEAPVELSSRVMASVTAESFGAFFWRILGAPFQFPAVRLFAPVAAAVLLLFLSRPYLPVEIRIANGVTSSSSDLAAIRPIWWGGNVYINDQAHPPSEAGRVTIRPGDSIRTSDRVELALCLADSTIDVRPRTSLIVKTDGLFLAGGKIQVKIEPPKAAAGHRLATFKVTTPNATVVHLGTVFGVLYSGLTTRTDVLEGKVRMFGNNGASQEIGAGEYASVDTGGVIQSGPSLDLPTSARLPRTQPEDVREINPRPNASSSAR